MTATHAIETVVRKNRRVFVRVFTAVVVTAVLTFTVVLVGSAAISVCVDWIYPPTPVLPVLSPAAFLTIVFRLI